jgi:hypothetical protein
MSLVYVQMRTNDLCAEEPKKIAAKIPTRTSSSDFRPHSDVTIFEEDGFEPIVEEEEEPDYHFNPYLNQFSGPSSSTYSSPSSSLSSNNVWATSSPSSSQSSNTAWARRSFTAGESIKSFKSTSTTTPSENATVVGSFYSDLNKAVTSIDLSRLSLDLDLDFSCLDFDLALPELTFSLPKPTLSRNDSLSSSSSTLLQNSNATRCADNCAVCSFSKRSSQLVEQSKSSKRASLKKHLDPRYLRNTYCPFEKARQRRDRRVAMQRYQKEFGVVPWTRDAENNERPSTAF